MAKKDGDFRICWSDTVNDISKTKFFMPSDGQLFSFAITNESRRSDQNSPITACAVAPAWGATAFSTRSSLLIVCTPELKLREVGGRINAILIRTLALPLINSLPTSQYGAGLDRVLYMTTNKIHTCRSHVGEFLRGHIVLAVQRLQKIEGLQLCHWFGSLTLAFLKVSEPGFVVKPWTPRNSRYQEDKYSLCPKFQFERRNQHSLVTFNRFKFRSIAITYMQR